MTFSQQDLAQIAQRGIRKEQIETQLNQFKTGFPFLRLEAAAAVGKGIIAPCAAERNDFVCQWEQYKKEGHRVVKFVPASGAASRMFKNMFAFVDADYDTPTTDFEKTYFQEIEKFAFYDALDAVCRKNEGKGIKELIAAGQYKAVAANMLKGEGLNYGQLPKGMLLFHKYEGNEVRTPMEEHLVEGALYAASKTPSTPPLGGDTRSNQFMAHVHFTVSHEHMDFFRQKVAEKADGFAQKYGVKYAEGRWVATIRWMPAARASCVSRQMYSSTSFLQTIIRSASSSMMITMRAMGRSPVFSTAWL